MVSKASDDLPEPLSPVTTVRVLRGISTSMFLRLCCRAPRTEILVIAMNDLCGAGVLPANFPPDPRTMSLGDVDGFPEKSDSGEAQLYSVS